MRIQVLLYSLIVRKRFHVYWCPEERILGYSAMFMEREKDKEEEVWKEEEVKKEE